MLGARWPRGTGPLSLNLVAKLGCPSSPMMPAAQGSSCSNAKCPALNGAVGVGWGAAEPVQEQPVPQGPAFVSPQRLGMPYSPHPRPKVTAFPPSPLPPAPARSQERIKAGSEKTNKHAGGKKKKNKQSLLPSSRSRQDPCKPLPGSPRPHNLLAAGAQPSTRCPAPAPRGDLARREATSDTSAASGGCRRGRRRAQISYDGHKLNFNRDVGGWEPARSGSGKVVIKS